MSNNSEDYTAEPWKIIERHQRLRDGREVVDIAGDTSKSPYEWEIVATKMLKPDARRAIAALHACKGIPTKALEEGVIGKLFTACEIAVIGFNRRTPDNEQFIDAICRQAQDASVDTATYILGLLRDALANTRGLEAEDRQLLESICDDGGIAVKRKGTL